MVLAMEQSPWKGPGGKSDSDRLYILCYDHTDWHCGRFSTEYIFGRHFYAGHQIPLMKYPRLKIGNQFGGGYYDWLATLDDTQNAFFFSSLQKLIKTYHCDIVGGTYSQPVSAFLPEETAIRQFTYGLEAIKSIPAWTSNATPSARIPAGTTSPKFSMISASREAFCAPTISPWGIRRNIPRRW